MTLLSRKADYALLILSHLHKHREGGTARAVAEQFGLSRAFVANILKELCHEGFVVSHRGVKGGYVLARSANTISLAELLESIEDGFRLTMCNPGTHSTSETCTLTATCTIKETMSEVHRRLIEVLRTVSLSELFESGVAKSSGLPDLPMLATVGGCCSQAESVEIASA